MFRFKRATFTVFIVSIFAANFSGHAQCPVTASASSLTINCGEGVDLSATGTPGFYIFENDFNTGTVGPGWQATSTAMYTNPCGSGPGGATDPHMWMGSSAAAPRNATTNAYDLSTGGTICFDMRYAIQGACGTVTTCDCEGPDLPDEGVHLQYSIDGGSTWIDIQYWDPMGGTDPTMTTWNYYCVTIPAGAMTSSTMIRWAQLTSSNAGSDHWGLDNITIATNDPNFMYDWTHDGLPASSTSATPTVYPTTNTNYTVVYANTAGTQSCSATITVNVVAPTVTATASPLTICQGASSQLLANSSLIATPPSNCGINTYSGCPANSQAGEPQIGTGTTIASYNSGANYVFGDFGSTGGVRTQIIYRASELTAAGFSAGQITNMQLDVGAIQTNSGSAGSVTLNSFSIQINCTSVNTFASSSSWQSGLTTVFPATNVTIVPGWNTFTFPNSYNWDGVSNIVVQLCWYNGSSGGNTCAKTRTQAAGFNSMIASYVNASGAALNCASHTSFQTLYTFRPNTRFGTCEPRNITLNYSWSPSGSLNNATIYNPAATPTATTTYTVSVSEAGSPAACAATSTVTVNVVSSNMTGTGASRCGTGTVTLSTTGCTGTINWYANASGGSPIGTGATFTTPSISSTTTYYATCTESGCESPRVPVVATVNPVPSSTFSIAPATICSGVNTTITYTGAVVAGQTYNWNFNGGTVTSGTGQGPYNVNWPNPTGGIYNVTLSVTSALGCTSTVTTQTATVSPGPDLSITPSNPSYCAPGSVNLTSNTVLNPANYTTSGSNGTDYIIPDNGVTAVWNGSSGTFTTSSTTISGLNPSSWNITSICLNINADKDQEVIVYLQNPCGGLIRLIRNNGGTANTGFNTTCFSPTAVTAISAGAAPFNGTFIPEQGAAAWTAFLACGTPNGTWSLLVGDAATSSPVAGILTAVTLTNWSINFTSANYITNYSWTPATNLTSTTTASTTASPSATTTYSLTVTDALGCPATEPVTVTVSNPAVATFSYTGTPYCQNASNPSPAFSGGGVAGTFTSTAGLSINASTGIVNLASSTTGTYTVTNTIAASDGCPPVTATSNITITPVPVATFSYTGTPYCQNAANPSPTFSSGGVTGTFTSTAGLSINASTGLVNLAASTAGTYAVTNTIAASGGCPSVNATSSITITAPQIATFSYTASPYCQNASNPSPTFSGGGVAGTFTSTAGLNINASTGAVNLAASTAGTYTVTNTIAASGGCPSVNSTASITITAPQVATFSYTGTPYCQNAANPSPTFSGGGVAGTFTSTVGLSINASTGVVNLPASTTGTYTITNTISASGGCAAVSATSSITITAPQVATFSYTASPYCQNASNPSPTFSGGGVAGTFTSTVGLSINASTGVVNLPASTTGTYTITNTIAASGGCPSVNATASITITAPQVATFSYTASPYCQNAANPSPTFSAGGVAGTFTSSAGLSINASTGVVNLTASTAGTYTVTNTIAASGGCAAVSATASITITSVQNAAFNYSSSTFCSTGSDPTPTITGTAGGSFTSSPAGLSINASTGTITLSTSTLNTYTVTYTTAGPCANSTSINLTITNAPSAAFSYTASPYCQNGTNPSPAFSGGGTAGTFTSSPAGLIFISSATGQVDLATSSPGTYTVTNTIPASGGCSAATATASITINAQPTATFSYTASPYCQNAANPSPTFSGGGIAGTFTSSAGLNINASTGVVNLAASTAGTYTVTNTITASASCPAVVATSDITIVSPQVATFSYTASPYCQNAANPSPTFSGGSVAGTFTSSAGLSINSATGEINLAASTAGTYSVTNTIAASGGCADVNATANVTITTPQVATFSYTASPYCQNASNPSPTFSGGGVGGTFSSSAGLSINSSTGEVNLAASTIGTYTVTNTIAASGGCPSVSSTASISIAAPQVATFSYTASPYCQNASNPSPTFSGGGVGGTFSSSAGLSINSSTGEVNLAASTIGTYTVTNTIAASGGCPSVSSTASISIAAPQVATFSYTASPYCQNAANPSPTFSGGGIAGTFTSSAGLNVSSVTGEINLGASTAGTYTVTNTIAASGGCAAVTATASITITPVQSAAFNYSSSTFCSTGSNPTPTITGTAGGIFTSSPAGLSIDGSTGTITLSTSTLNTYSVTYTTPGPCASSASINLTITNSPSATFSYTASPYCQNGTNPSPVFSGGGTAGTFSSSGGLSINSTDGTINLAASTPGTYTVTNTIAAAGGCAAASDTGNVTIDPVQNSGFNYSSPTFCQAGSNPTPTITGVAGGTFSASPVGITFISTATGEIDLAASALNTYTITYITAGPCPSSSTASVTISNPTSATMNYNGPYCQNASNPFPVFAASSSAGVFTSTPAGLVFVSTSTGEVDLLASTPGSYTITNTIAASGACPASIDTAAITITLPASGAFAYTGSPFCQNTSNPSPVYSGGGVAGTFSASSSSLIFVSTSTGEIDLSASTPGTYTVSNSIAASGGCAAITEITTVTINPLQNASFNYSTSTFCQSGSNPSPTITGTSGGTFTSSPTGLVFVSSSTGEINLASSGLNSYTITYTTAGPCANSLTATVTISNAPAATFSYSGPYCQNDPDPSPTFIGAGTAGTFSSSSGLVFVSTSSGQIDLAASTPGTYVVTNTIPASGGCAAASENSSITISPLENASFSYASSTFCQSGTNPAATITGTTGGMFSSSPAGLSFVSTSTGEIDLAGSSLNTYTITYATPGPCTNTSTVTVTITSTPVATFSYTGTPYCQSASNPSPVFSAGGSAGTFTSSTGLSINASNGDVNLSASTPGTYTVTNTITTSGCPSATATATIVITAPQSTSFSYTGSPYCQNALNPSPAFSGGGIAGTFSAPTGLVFVSSSTGEINLAASTAGTYTVTNSIAASGGCPATSSTGTITINPVQNAAFNYSASTFCSSGANPSPTITGTPGGSFSASPAGLVFASSSTGEINLASSGLNTYTITYMTPGPCANSSTLNVTITNSPSAIFSYTGTPYCQSASNPSPDFAAGSSGGTFNSTVGLSINSSTGIVDLAASSPGTYSVTNTIAASGGCPSSNATTSITITAPQTGTFSYTSSSYCQNGTDPSPVISSGSIAGVFSSGGGLNINSGTGVVDLFSSTPGTYTVTNTIPAAGGCPVSTYSSIITIDPLQNAAFSYSSAAFCQSSVDPAPFIIGVSGGSFASSPAGLTINGSTGQVTLSSSTINTYTITYTTPGPCANSSTATLTITANPSATASVNGTVCEGDFINLASSGGTTYSWSGPLSYTSNIQNPSINPVTVADAGTYTVTVTNGSCMDTAQVYVAVNPVPVADAGSDVTIIAGTSTDLNASGGNSYNWTPAIGLSCSNCPDPVATPTVTTTYCVVTASNSCSSNGCVTITVKMPCNNEELGVPNAFSPNNDGNNDQFCLLGWTECMDQFSILIFDRWGEKVFESQETGFCWDGSFRGKTLDPAVFVYVIQATFFNNESILKKGNITIIK